MAGLGGAVVITGGAGFIGSHLADSLLRRGLDVSVIDNFDPYYSGKEANVRHNLGNRRYRLIKGDIMDLDLLTRSLRGAATVFHLAAQPGVRYSVSHPHKVLRVNIEGTLNVLVAARKSEVDKVIYASSSSVYGAPRYLPIDEGHPAVPVSPYGASKLAAEGYCRVFQELYGIKVVILRYFTAYGPRQRPDMAIHRFARAILEGKPITVYGDGAQTRDFTYVEDIVRGTILAAEKGEAVGQCFNLGGGRRTSINALVRLLEEVSGREAKVAYVEPMLGDVPHTHADVSKARRVLGYEPRVGLRDGLSAFVDWLDKGLGRRVNPVEKEDPIGTRGRIAP